MTNMFNNNFNPNGYDTRYFISYYNSFNDEIENRKSSLVNFGITNSDITSDITKEALNRIENNQLENSSNSEVILLEKSEDYIEELDGISLLKVNYIVEVIKRKLNILHRITKNRALKKKRIPDSVIIEREIEKRAKLLITDMLTLLKLVDKDKTMETQQKVILLSEINKKSKLTVDEKIAIIKRLIAMDIIEDNPSKKHIKNKLILLFIVKETGFSIDVTKLKDYKPVMQSVEEEPVSLEVNEENTNEENTDNIINNEFDTQNNLDDKTTQSNKKLITNTEAADKSTNHIKSPTITKAFVNSKRHFKFGAGFIAKNKTLSILLPSGYILDDSNRAYQISQPYISNNSKKSNSSFINSPLYIEFIKQNKPADYTLLDFFNSNIIECKAENLKYRQTLISKSPALIKHQPNKNIYKASVFIKKMNCVYDIQFKFKKTVANKASTVNRILASIKFEGM